MRRVDGAIDRDPSPAGGSGFSQSPFGQTLTRLDAWALCLGCAVGWGAFVMPGTTLIPLAGPVGTLVALCLATLSMMVIAVSYGFVGHRDAQPGGSFGYVARIFGHDHAFLCGWTVFLAYIAIMWANATAIVLMARYVLGPALQAGRLWQIAGYDVYAGEVVVTVGIIAASGALSCLNPRLSRLLNTGLALVMLGGTLGCLGWAISRGGFAHASLNPRLAAGNNGLRGLADVVALAPWAFVGFESVSHVQQELRNRRQGQGVLRVLLLGLLAAGCVYAATTLLTVLVVPAPYASWAEYLAALPSLEGLAGLPVFNAMATTAGPAGLTLLYASVLSAVTTSLLGLYRTTSRLVYAMAQEGILKPRFLQLDGRGVPRNAIILVMLISLPVPLVGRAAVGWIVDVTSVCASIAYCYVCLCARKVALDEGNRRMAAMASVGAVISAAFFVFPLVPSFWSVTALQSESYLILSAWAVLGLLLFWLVFRRDETGRFGKSTVVWIALLFLIFFSSTMWVRQATNATAERVVERIDIYHDELQERHGVPLSETERTEEDSFVSQQTATLRDNLLDSSLVQMGLMAFGLYIMFRIYSLMSARQAELDAARMAAEETSRAKTMFLSNVSHDIRTPMNAIVGYTRQARQEGLSPQEVQQYLARIDSASTYMVSLVSDVLEMGRMESGHLQLRLTTVDLRQVMDDVADVFYGQMAQKGIAFEVDVANVTRPLVRCDVDRLNSILLNLVSNAYKFTDAGGRVTVSLSNDSVVDQGTCTYELRVCDTGAGMSEEFVERLFEPFEREHSATESGVQGTGLGMSITKGVVSAMGGTISVASRKGEGTEFVVRLPLELEGDGLVSPADAARQDGTPHKPLAGCVLVVDDNEINREVASFVLEDLGLTVQVARDGAEAVACVRDAEPGHFAAVLMDVQMPQMDGYEATRCIRALPDAQKAKVPVVALSANAYDEDVQAALASGMNAHLAKPLDEEDAYRVLSGLLG